MRGEAAPSGILDPRRTVSLRCCGVVSLGVGECSPPTKASPASAGTTWTERGRKNGAHRELLAQVLREERLQVVEVEDGVALLNEMTRSLSPEGELTGFDLVVTDIHMPGYSALDVLTGAAGCCAGRLSSS